MFFNCNQSFYNLNSNSRSSMKHKNTKYKFNNKVLSQTCMKLQNFTTSSTQTLVCIILLNNYMHYIAQNQKKFYCMTTNKVSIIIYRIHIRYRLKKTVETLSKIPLLF